jgi:uncharacterized protein (TIGR02145 family)
MLIFSTRPALVFGKKTCSHDKNRAAVVFISTRFTLAVDAYLIQRERIPSDYPDGLTWPEYSQQPGFPTIHGRTANTDDWLLRIRARFDEHQQACAHRAPAGFVLQKRQRLPYRSRHSSFTTSADSIKKYGLLYNWYSVDSKKLAPPGWHVSTHGDWDTLSAYLIANGYNWDGTTTGNKIAQSLTSKTDWAASETKGTPGNDLAANNLSGFTAIPAGVRYSIFMARANYSTWWTATSLTQTISRAVMLARNSGDLNLSNGLGCYFGLAVRLVKD